MHFSSCLKEEKAALKLFFPCLLLLCPTGATANLQAVTSIACATTGGSGVPREHRVPLPTRCFSGSPAAFPRGRLRLHPAQARWAVSPGRQYRRRKREGGGAAGAARPVTNPRSQAPSRAPSRCFPRFPSRVPAAQRGLFPRNRPGPARGRTRTGTPPPCVALRRRPAPPASLERAVPGAREGCRAVPLYWRNPRGRVTSDGPGGRGVVGWSVGRSAGGGEGCSGSAASGLAARGRPAPESASEERAKGAGGSASATWQGARARPPERERERESERERASARGVARRGGEGRGRGAPAPGRPRGAWRAAWAARRAGARPGSSLWETVTARPGERGRAAAEGARPHEAAGGGDRGRGPGPGPARARAAGPEQRWGGKGTAEGPDPIMASGGGGGGVGGGGGKIRTRRYHLGAVKPPYARSKQVRRGGWRPKAHRGREGPFPSAPPTAAPSAARGGPARRSRPFPPPAPISPRARLWGRGFPVERPRGRGGGGGGKEKGFPPGPRGFWDFRALGPLRRQPRPAGGSSAPFCLPPGRGRCPALGREQRREKEKEAAAAGQG